MSHFPANLMQVMPWSIDRTRSLCLSGLAAAYLFILPFSSSIALRNILLGALVLMILWGWYRGAWLRNKLHTPPLFITIVFSLWTALSIASLLWSIDAAYSAHELKSEIFYAWLVLGSFWVVGNRSDEKMLTQTLWGILIGFIVISAIAVGFRVDDARELRAWFGGIGPLSTHLVFIASAIMAITVMASGEPRLQIGKFLFITLLVFALIAVAIITKNRIIWFALATQLTVYLILANRLFTKPKHWLATIIIFLLLQSVAVAFATMVADMRFSELENFDLSDQLKRDERIPIWTLAADKILAAPLLGYGYGRGILREVFTQYFANYANSGAMSHAHNIWLSVTLQTGVLGLVIFIVLLVSILTCYGKIYRSPNVLQQKIGAIGIALVVSFLIKNQTDDFFVRHNALTFWALNALLLGFAWRELGKAPSHSKLAQQL